MKKSNYKEHACEFVGPEVCEESLEAEGWDVKTEEREFYEESNED